jgi:hypothetical protein
MPIGVVVSGLAAGRAIHFQPKTVIVNMATYNGISIACIAEH